MKDFPVDSLLPESKMKISTKRSASTEIDHRSTKRRKSTSAGTVLVYSTREIPWEEQLRLPEKFHINGEGTWPASKILREKKVGKRTEYLVEWEQHPETGENWQPTWLLPEHVGDSLLDEWYQEQDNPTQGWESQPRHRVDRPVVGQKSLRSGSNVRGHKNRRIIPDSSADSHDIVRARTELSRTPTLASSPGSFEAAASPIEILETQQTTIQNIVSINIPPPPDDKADFETIYSSQFSIGGPAPGTCSSRFGTTQGGCQEIAADLDPSKVTTPVSVFESSPLRSLRSQRSRTSDVSGSPSRILSYQPDLVISASAEQVDKVQNSLEARDSPALAVHEISPPFNRPTHFADHNTNSIQRETTTVEPVIRPIAYSPPIKSRTQSQSQPWVFKSQLPISSQVSDASLDSINPSMATRSTRQSPRLQTAVPILNGTSPRATGRNGLSRTRIVTAAPEISSPLATAIPELPEEEHAASSKPLLDSPTTNRDFNIDFSDTITSVPLVPPVTIPPSDMHIDPTAHMGSATTQSSAEEMEYGTIAMPIQQSIEDEHGSYNEDTSLESKASSSQDSLKNERLIPQVGGLLMPSYPILGDSEYTIALPAEGKVQAIYSQTIKTKRRSILKFIHRRGSVNTAGTSSTKTIERNNMLELIQRLHDTTTHIDLGLPGIPTQYSIPSQEHALYARYAGSKFVFLGSLIDSMMRRDCTLAIMANEGATHDLLEEYLHIKQVNVRRQGRIRSAFPDASSQATALKVELLSTKATNIVHLAQRPAIIIAFDASFESQSPQLQHIRAQFSESLPVLHLIVTNSSEHVERCLPVSMPSPLRLKTLVRATYQAHKNLGGSPTYVTDSSDELNDGRPMDLGDLHRLIRKSPQRKLSMVAAIVAATALSDDFAGNWTLHGMPELALDELEDTPPSSKESRATSVTPNNRRGRSQTPNARIGIHARNRSQTPLSRIGTPNNRKRQLDIDSTNNVTKRQRMTPVDESHGTVYSENGKNRLEELEHALDAARVELATERRLRQAAEEARAVAEQKQHEWRSSLAVLQRRYEKRMKKTHQLQRDVGTLSATTENAKARMEQLNAENILLKENLVHAQSELVIARTALQSASGDTAVTDFAQEEARAVMGKTAALEKSLLNTKRDFEFTRTQYQDASSKAVEFASRVTELETQNTLLERQASGEARKLKELSHRESIRRHIAKIEELELGMRSREVLLKKQDDEIKLLKRNRGVQTRGSSAQPPGSPAPRSRQASPAHIVPPGSRTSALRHER